MDQCVRVWSYHSAAADTSEGIAARSCHAYQHVGPREMDVRVRRSRLMVLLR